MPSYKNLDELFNAINKSVRYGVKLLAEEVEQEVKDYIITNLYQAYTPVDYARTYDFVNSVVHTKPVKINDGWEVTVYFDTDKIVANLMEDSWNQHMSFSQQDVSEFIPLWLEEGTDNKYYSHEGIRSMETVATEFDLFKSSFVKHMQSKGIKVTLQSFGGTD